MDSGLNGIELGSIPFLNDWLREAIRSALSNYVAPKYINIDMEELLKHRQVCIAFACFGQNGVVSHRLSNENSCGLVAGTSKIRPYCRFQRLAIYDERLALQYLVQERLLHEELPLPL